LFFKVLFSLVLEVEIVQKLKTFHGWRRIFVECTPTIPFSNTSSVGIVVFANPHKVVA
jgi:hypothetical protein